MEIKAQLNKPYGEEERIDFIVEQNHKNGYTIEETETSLQAKGYTEDELVQKEQERISMLSLTAADVERGIYKATGKDFDDVINYVENLIVNDSVTANDSVAVQLDIKALKIELKANNFYRGNPYVDTIGTLLGFTKKQLDEFFETNDYTVLLNDGEVS